MPCSPVWARRACASSRWIPSTCCRKSSPIPAPYGISNVTGTACNPQLTASSLTCSPANYAAADAPTSYAFADGVHPSSRSHEILADYAVSVLEGPRQIALLSYTASVIGRARADRVGLPRQWQARSRRHALVGRSAR